MPNKTAQAEKQRRRETKIRRRDHEPHPPDPMPQRFPMGMPAHKRQSNQHCGRDERERCRVVACLPHRSMQTRRFRRGLSWSGGLRHQARMRRPSDSGDSSTAVRLGNDNNCLCRMRRARLCRNRSAPQERRRAHPSHTPATGPVSGACEIAGQELNCDLRVSGSTPRPRSRGNPCSLAASRVQAERRS